MCPARFGRALFSAEVDTALRDVCQEIAAQYVLTFLEIGTDRNHVRFLGRTFPAYSPSKLVRIIQSFTAREILRRVPAPKEFLWGGELWSDGTYLNTLSPHSSEEEFRR